MQIQPLSYEKIRVRPDRIELLVRVSCMRFCDTTPHLIALCKRDFPLLSAHACKNELGSTFGAVMNQTSVPHLLEHLIIDLQMQALDTLLSQQENRMSLAIPSLSDDIVITGTTQWDQDDSLLAHVSISFIDDIIALSSCKKALAYLNDLLLK